MRVLIIGAGGHGQVVADILLSRQESGLGEVELVGFLDDNPTLHQTAWLGVPVLGSVSLASALAHEGVVVAVGDNRIRQQLSHRLQAGGEQLVTAIHPRAVIGRAVSIGAGTMICAGVVVNTGSALGQGVILNTGCTVDHHNQIEDYVHIAPGAHLGGDVTVGEGTLVGIGATVMPQRRVGTWSVVGAGAIVTKDVPAGSTVVGFPARRVQSG